MRSIFFFFFFFFFGGGGGGLFAAHGFRVHACRILKGKSGTGLT